MAKLEGADRPRYTCDWCGEQLTSAETLAVKLVVRARVKGSSVEVCERAEVKDACADCAGDLSVEKLPDEVGAPLEEHLMPEAPCADTDR